MIEALLPLMSFAFVSSITPGPNNIMLTSSGIWFGFRRSLPHMLGITFGFGVLLAICAFGIGELVVALPQVVLLLKALGCAYLLYLAWQALKPGGRSPFALRTLPPDSPRKLFSMGLLTSLLNPKIAVMYLSLLPQFIQPEHGSVLLQSFALGLTQIVVGVSMNAVITLSAASISALLAGRPHWQRLQRWLMGTVLAGFALRMAMEARR